MRKSSLLIVVASLIFPISAIASDVWPAWRGPSANGVSADGNPPIKWSETENVKWKVALTGDGSDSSPVIWKDKIIFQTAVKTDKTGPGAPAAEPQAGGRRRFGGRKPKNIYQFNVICLNRANGKPLWQRKVCELLPHEGHHGDHGLASYSPVTDGKHIWASFGSRGVYCLDMAGNILWDKDLGKMQIRAGFGEGSSPIIVDDKLIVLMDHEGDSSITALNKLTGKKIWKKSRNERTSWTTPLAVNVGGKTQIIVTGHNFTIGYNAADGAEIWKCGGGQTENVIPAPVTGFGMVYCTSGFRGKMLQAVKLGQTGDLTGTKAVVWKKDDKGTPYVPSPILCGEKLYVCSANRGVISCYNAKTGKPYYTEQKLDQMKGIYASPVAAAGNVYFTGRKGTTYVLKNSDDLQTLSINKLNDEIDASMAIIGNEIYLKGTKFLYCIAKK